MHYFILIIIVVVSACSTQQQNFSVSRSSDTPPLPVATLESIAGNSNTSNSVAESLPLSKVFSLTKEQEKHFLQAFNSKSYSSFQPNRRVFRYLKSYLKNFNFYSNTLIAEEALNKNFGNCLSLAILTKALADKVGVRVGYELVSTTPVYQREGEITLSSQHVRTILYGDAVRSETNMYIIGADNIVVDYFPARGSRRLRRVSENEFYSMFYRNRAAEALIENNILLAYINAKQALALAPMEPQAINLMAVIHQRVNLTEYADNIYQYALKYGRESLELLSNYHSFLMGNGRYAEADQVKIKLDKYEDLNPFVWVDLGNTAYDNKDYHQAIRYYRKARKLADYIHEPFLGMAKAYFKLGEIRTAKSMLKKAIENAHKNETRTIYQKKYDLLSKYAAQ